MMIPRRKNEFDLLDEMFRDPFILDNQNKIMKTDIKENTNSYIIQVDLPGYEKENIKIEVENGYLTVQATVDTNKEEREEGKVVRKERYVGSCSRSFFVGEEVENTEIKATLKNGTLKIDIPKKEEKKEIPQKKYIEIQ